MNVLRHRYSQFVVTGMIITSAIALTACSSSSKSPAPVSSTASVSGSSSPGAGATASTDGPGTPADTATVAAVTKAYQDFFDYQSTAAQSQNALQAGDRFTAVLAQQGTQSYAQKSAATVSSVRLISPDTAKVVFSVLVAGKPLLPDADGYAVRIDGSWKVAAATFCSLLSLQGDNTPACKDPSVTALPK